MLESEEYLPSREKESFINKSILSLFGILSRLRGQDSSGQNGFEVNAFFKLLFTFMLILLVSLSRHFSFIFIVITYFLVFLMFMPVKKIIRILASGVIISLMSFIIMLPSVFFYGNSYSFIMLPVKVLTTVIAVNILIYTSKWNELIGAIKWFRVPDIFIFVLDIAIKYILMLGEFSLEMLYALKLRCVGKNRNKTSSLSGVAGTMFVKSREMAEEMIGAMECRGFTGEYRSVHTFRFSPMDAAYTLANMALLFAFLYLRGHHV